jgi:uncharacterized protein
MPVSPSRISHRRPRSPFLLDTRELGRRPGTMRTVRREVAAPAGLAATIVGVSEGASLVLDLRLEAATEGVLVTGTVTASTTGECGRCLEPVSAELVVDVCELFAYPDSVTDETTDEDEVDRILDDLIDMEPVVRDAIVLGLPVTPLCRPDCAGLCPDCGQKLDDLRADHAHGRIDPRWAGLATRLPASATASETGSQE